MTRAQRETSSQLQALMPFVLHQPLPPSGPYLGDDIFRRPFHFDPIRLRQEAGLGLHDPNLLVLGQIGMGKSSLAKLLAARLSVFGYSIAYLDPKGETAPLAAAFSTTPVRLGPGSPDRIDPFQILSAAGDLQTLEHGLQSVLAAMLHRRLSLPEQQALAEGVQMVMRKATTPSLGELLAVLKRTPEIELSLALSAFIHAAGLDLVNTERQPFGGRFLSVDLSAGLGVAATDQLRSALTTMVSLWLSQALAAMPAPRLFVLDEAWALLRDPAAAEWLQRQWKLARARATVNVAVLHRLSDLEAAGASRELALGLLADTQTRVVFRQPPSELALLRAWLGLNEPEVEVVGSLPRGWALWKIGSRSFVVQLHIQEWERHLVDTEPVLHPPDVTGSGILPLSAPVVVPFQGADASSPSGTGAEPSPGPVAP